jgi:hypothetical protein
LHSGSGFGNLKSMFLHFIYQWASLIVLGLCVVIGLWRGGWPERTAALAMVAAWFGTSLAQNSLQRWGVQTGVMLVDAGLLAVLLFVALRSDRWWPMWASGFQAMNVTLHLSVLADGKVWGWSYFLASSIFSYLTMLSLLFGALSRRRQNPAPPDAASPLT